MTHQKLVNHITLIYEPNLYKNLSHLPRCSDDITIYRPEYRKNILKLKSNKKSNQI